MKAKREYRSRPETEVAVLDALVDRNEDGMTVFELRSRVDVDIDELEDALGNLKTDDLIAADQNGNRTVITPDEQVIPDPGSDDGEPSLVDQILDRISL